MSDPRLKKLAQLLVEYSTEVKKGDRVFVSAEDAAIPYITEVAKAAIAKGAIVETTVKLPAVDESLYKLGSDEQIAQENFFFRKIVESADVHLTAWGTNNTRANSNIDPLKIQMRARANKEVRELFSEKVGKNIIRWCGTQFPTHADAQEANMSLAEYEDFVYGAGLLDKADPIAEWHRIHEEQERWVNYLDKKKMLHIISEGTDIKVNIEGRKWVNCSGKANFPDGEIFTSPVENDINGFITFSFPGIYAGKEIEGIYLEVEKGKVVKATAKKGEDLLHALLATDEGASYFGEVAIGTNYGIQQFTRNMLFDEKIGGTVHMAIGESMLEANGKNRSTIHWDMLCDMRESGKIYADGELFYVDGKFIDSVLAE